MTTLTTPEALAVLQAIAESGFVRDNAPADAVAHLASRIAELEAELAAVREDGEARLYWLMANPGLITQCSGQWFAASGSVVFQADNPIDAIDAAREGK